MSEIKKKVESFFNQYPCFSAPKGKMLISAHEPYPNKVFFILEGRVIQYGISVKGNKSILNTFKPGAFFPMSVQIGESPNRYFFETSEDTIYHTAPANKASDLLKNNPDIQLDLLRRLFVGANGLLDRLNLLLCKDPKSMLLSELYIEALRFGTITPNKKVTLNLTQANLASRTGLARETINRQLASADIKELVAVNRGTLAIKNFDKFKKIFTP